jgi:hypothetical protein
MRQGDSAFVFGRARGWTVGGTWLGVRDRGCHDPSPAVGMTVGWLLEEPGNARCRDPREIPLFARNDGWVVGIELCRNGRRIGPRWGYPCVFSMCGKQSGYGTMACAASSMKKNSTSCSAPLNIHGLKSDTVGEFGSGWISNELLPDPHGPRTRSVSEVRRDYALANLYRAAGAEGWRVSSCGRIVVGGPPLEMAIRIFRGRRGVVLGGSRSCGRFRGWRRCRGALRPSWRKCCEGLRGVRARPNRTPNPWMT